MGSFFKKTGKTKFRCCTRSLTLPFLLIGLLQAGCGEEVSQQPLRVSLTTATKPSFVQTVYGPVRYGPEFGLNLTKENFITFESHATATQNVLSGQSSIMGGSFISHLLIRENNQDIKVFCPFVNLDDFVIAGRNGVTRVEQLFDPKVRVAIDSPGGAGGIILNAMLQAAGTGRTVADIPNVRILESSSLRTSVFAADGVDATVLHLSQLKQAASQVPDAVIITSLWEDVPVFIKEAYAAPARWLDENQEVAAAFCASVLKASRELPQDFELYVAAVQEFVGEPPNQEVLREIFDLISKYEFWPKDGDLEPESITFMAQIAQQAGVLKEVPDPEKVVDRRPLKQALKMLGGKAKRAPTG